MSSTVLEQLRAEQEEIEAIERTVVAILGEKPRNHRERVLHGHKVSHLLTEATTRSRHVKELYEDKDGTFAEETESMRGRAVFTSFYEQLKSVRAFHHKYPHTVIAHEPNLQEALNPTVAFSGEERFGKYVDLNEFYARFVNIPAFKWAMRGKDVGSRRSRRSQGNAGDARANGAGVDYLTFLAHFSEFSDIPQAEKLRSSAYQTYLRDLKAYLLDFYRRTQPLVDLDDVVAETEAKFEKQWALNEVKGWDRGAYGSSGEDTGGAKADPLFCALCDKQFSSEGVFNGHLNGKKHKKAAAAAASDSSKSRGSADTGAPAASSSAQMKEIAFDEVLIRRLYELLTEVVHATIAYLELKQTRTHEELQAEIAEEEEGAFSDVELEEHADGQDEDDDEQPFHNPLNLPLGWDGKPIPYWLYKLHGLGVEFKCEICGNHSYWGRRAFDRHFQEWRHAFGMRCLRIPNTKHFHDITLMRDAIQLYEKLKDQIDAESWDPTQEEEFEDSEGNVLSRKTYEDLARQGLL